MRVSPPISWQISSYSGGEACVEVRRSGDVMLVRHSRNRRQGLVAVPVVWWKVFLDNVTGDQGPRWRPWPWPAVLPQIGHRAGGDVELRAVDGTTLSFSAAEWRAFTRGIRAAEFELH